MRMDRTCPATMSIGEVKQDARRHQRCTGQHPDAAASFAKDERQRGADERRECEYRAGARRAEGALCEQVEAQAQAVAGGADGKKSQRLPDGWQGFAEHKRQQRRGERAEGALVHHHLARITPGHGPR